LRFSPKYFEELLEFDEENSSGHYFLLEFEVEMNEIHLDEEQNGKDVVVNWRILDGFDNKGRFWTDSNALSM